MEKLTRDDLYSLEKYAEMRDAYRQQVMLHKQNRQLAIGPNATLYFEDRLTIQYQIQEMLRIEKIFEADAIQEELDAYNPLIPDGANLKATFMIEFADVEERRKALARLQEIEHKTWLKADDHEKVYPVADEDLERTTEEKTSAVHFLRFEFTPEMIAALKQDGSLSAGIEHDNYTYLVEPVPANIRDALVADLD